VASGTETSLITTNPAQVQQIQAGEMEQPQGTIDLNNQLYPGV
jgi:hypothetical protein